MGGETQDSPGKRDMEAVEGREPMRLLILLLLPLFEELGLGFCCGVGGLEVGFVELRFWVRSDVFCLDISGFLELFLDKYS